MTSTSFNVGLGDDKRLSSRVLRPPGGGHTDIFGGEPEPPRTGRRLQPCKMPGMATPPAPEKATTNEVPAQNGQDNTETPPAEPVQEAAGNNDASKDNNDAVVSEPPKTEPPKTTVEPPKRVRVPPGGFSSKLW